VEEERALGQHLAEALHERPHPLAGSRGDREHVVADVERGGGLQRQHGPRPVEAVDLVHHDDDGQPRFAQKRREEAVAGADALLPVHDEQRDVGVGELALDARLHPRGERVARALHARQVDEHDLAVIVRRHAADRPPRRLRLVGDDRDLPPDDRVHERRLADVRPAGEGDEAGAAHESHVSSSRWSASISPSSVS
jgi:hypothetical protein